MHSKLGMWCGALMEAAWLAAAAATPFYFNISSSQVFEPDKMLVLKFFAILSGAACVVKIVDSARQRRIEDEIPQGRFLYNPIAIAVVCLAAVWTLSSIFSILPARSWWGSFERAQGTFALYAYVILFLVVLLELRSAAQLRRLQFAFILPAFPISAYAILQYLGSDPLPWSNPVAGRSSASMGNPIFLGAYLIMAIPLTVSGIADAAGMMRSDGKKSGKLLALCCSAGLALQLIALLCTQSRGPVMGLAAAAYLCFFVLLAMKRNARKAPSLKWTGAAALATAAPVLVLAAAWFMGGTKAISSFGREVQEAEATVSVRVCLWQTAVSALGSSVSSPSPSGIVPDPLHWLRPAIGYGPECIGHRANLNAVPGLVKLHADQTVDRLHNEIFDSLISTGLLGAIAVLFLFAAAFYSALRYLGFPCGGGRRFLFPAFAVAGSVAGVLLPWAVGAPYFAGIGIQVGLLAGVFAFAAWSAFRNLITGSAGSRSTLVLCLLAALTAHFVETGVGIAVTPTRTCLFLMLAVLAVLTSGELKGDEAVKRRASRPARWFRNPLLPMAAVACIVLLLEGWCFLINTGDEQSALSLFLETWFSRPPGSRFFLPGTLTLLALTVLGSLGLMAGEIPRLEALRLKFRQAAVAPIISMILTWLAGGLLAAVFWTALDADAATPLNVSARAEARMTYLLCALLLLWIAAALSLAAAARDDSRHPASSSVGMRRLWPALLLAICALAAISEMVLRPARSDVARRIASICEASGNYPGAIQVYERAVELSPRTAANHLSLGFARSRAAMSEKGRGRESLLEAAAQSYAWALEINPLDPAAQRAAAFFYIQTGESLADPRQRDETLRRALPFLEQAARLAPAYPDAYTELGRCYFLLGEEARAGELYNKALQLNPLFSRTHMFFGEMHYRRKNYDQALNSFMQASQNDLQNREARKDAAAMLVLLGRGQKAVELYLQALEIWPQDADLLRRLASLYFSLDNYNSGITYARRAYAALPPAAAGSFDAFLQQLRNAEIR